MPKHPIVAALCSHSQTDTALRGYWPMQRRGSIT